MRECKSHALEESGVDPNRLPSVLKSPQASIERLQWKCCNFESGDGGGSERNWAARSQAARSNSWSMNRFCWRTA
jgi:hypothetical protein